MSSLITPSLIELRNVRDEFKHLIEIRAPEQLFQSLFSRCPYVLSEALPLKIQNTLIKPLARPGKSDPDFIIVPNSFSSFENIGIIEIKRPTTKLITTPRKGIALLSRDLATALEQGKLYCKKLRAELAPRYSQNLIVGNNDFIFIIAGLTNEFTRKLNTYALFEAFKNQVPGGCQIIPYDELLKRFEQLIPPIVFSLTPIEQTPPLYDLDKISSIANSNYARRTAINDDNMNFWSDLEDKWKAGKYIGSSVQRYINRPYWCISGTDILATESPAHLDFPLYVKSFVDAINLSVKFHHILDTSQSEGWTLQELRKILTHRQIQELSEAVERCRKEKYYSTFLQQDNPDIELLASLGLIKFSAIDAGETYYKVNDIVLKLW